MEKVEDRNHVGRVVVLLFDVREKISHEQSRRLEEADQVIEVLGFLSFSKVTLGRVVFSFRKPTHILFQHLLAS